MYLFYLSHTDIVSVFFGMESGVLTTQDRELFIVTKGWFKGSPRAEARKEKVSQSASLPLPGREATSKSWYYCSTCRPQKHRPWMGVFAFLSSHSPRLRAPAQRRTRNAIRNLCFALTRIVHSRPGERSRETRKSNHCDEAPLEGVLAAVRGGTRVMASL